MLSPAWYQIHKPICGCGNLLQVEAEVNAELGLRIHLHCSQCGQKSTKTYSLVKLMAVCATHDLRKEKLRTGGLLPESAIQHEDEIFLHSVGAHSGLDAR
jgi:hypothetical protein